MSTLNYWNYPTEILCGVGALDQLAERCRLAGMRKPLLVTDPGMLELPPLHEVRRRLEAAAGMQVGARGDAQLAAEYESLQLRGQRFGTAIGQYQPQGLIGDAA